MNPATTEQLLPQARDLHARGQLQEAAALYLRILDIDPAHFDATHLLGVYALQIGDLAAAHDLIVKALEIEPESAAARVHLSAVLQRQGRMDAAYAEIQRALALQPENLDALSNGGGLLAFHLKRPAEALPLLERALSIAPDHADALNNLGYALVELHRHEEALLCLERALALKPDLALAWYNRGNALQLLNRVDEALHSYDAALAINPELADAQFSQGVCRLLAGDLERGWPQYEWRWRKPGHQLPRYPEPLWTGEAPLHGKTLLVHHEQGLGDTLHMCRYAPLLAAQGARVILRVQPSLKPLLAGAYDVVSSDERLPRFDLHIAMLSLPMALRTRLDTIPAAVPYVSAPADRIAAWAQKLGPAAKRRLGLAWSGNPKHENDRKRSIPLTLMRRLLTPAWDCIALQTDLRVTDRLLLAREPALRSYATDQHDFAETAALVAQLDLVICVDTAIAHLAGAMGKPVWLLLPYAPDWRWMLDGETSPWYPNMRLFRQRREGDWDEVLARVAQALAAYP